MSNISDITTFAFKESGAAFRLYFQPLQELAIILGLAKKPPQDRSGALESHTWQRVFFVASPPKGFEGNSTSEADRGAERHGGGAA